MTVNVVGSFTAFDWIAQLAADSARSKTLLSIVPSASVSHALAASDVDAGAALAPAWSVSAHTSSAQIATGAPVRRANVLRFFNDVRL